MFDADSFSTFDTMLYVLLYVHLVIVLCSISCGAVGVMFAPFAALICNVRARRMRLDLLRYSVAGFAYSAFLVFPCVYLLARMYGKSISSAMARVAYIVLYGVIWLFGSIGLIVLAILNYQYADIETSTRVVGTIVYSLLLFMNTLTWIASLLDLRRNYRRRRGQNAPSDRMLLERAYIMPFAYAFVWVAAEFVVYFFYPTA